MVVPHLYRQFAVKRRVGAARAGSLATQNNFAKTLFAGNF